MGKYFAIAVFSLMFLFACTSNEETTSLTGITINTNLGSKEVSPGLSTTFSAAIINNYPEDLTNTQVRLIHSSDLTVSDDAKTGLTIPKSGTPYTVPYQIQVSPDAIKRDYTLRVQVCFDYESKGYNEIIFNNGESVSLPQKGSETAPLKISISNLELPINTRSIKEAFALVKIENTGNGRIVESVGNTEEVVDIMIEIENTGSYLSVDENQLTSQLEVVPEGDVEYQNGKIKVRTPADQGFLALGGNIEFVVPIEISPPTNEEIRTLNVAATYTYCVESTPLTLTVK